MINLTRITYTFGRFELFYDLAGKDVAGKQVWKVMIWRNRTMGKSIRNYIGPPPTIEDAKLDLSNGIRKLTALE